MSRRSCVGRSDLEQVAEYSTKANAPLPICQRDRSGAPHGRLCDALVEPAYRSALAYRERDGSTALGATRLWPACPRTRSHIGMGHDPEVPVGDAPERAHRTLQRSTHRARQIGT